MKEFSVSSDVKMMLEHKENKDLVAEMQKHTQEYAALRDDLEGLFISDATSYVWTHSSPEYVGMVTRKTDEELQQMYEWLSNGKTHVTGIMVSPASGQLSLAMYYPIRNEKGELLGWCGLGILTKELSRSLLEGMVKM